MGKYFRADPERNFIRECIDDYLDQSPSNRIADIYTRMDIPRQDLNSYMEKGKCSTPLPWSSLRKALGWSRKRFWLKALHYFDPKPEGKKGD